MSSNKVSVFIIACNAEQYLKEVLAPLTAFDEVVLVDSGSTDNTVAIAEEFGARVFHQDWLGFAKQKSLAMSYCNNEWVLNIDSDEVLSNEQVTNILEQTQADTADAFWLHFEDEFWGRAMSKHSAKRKIIRLFKKSVAQYPTNRLVHENIELSKGARVGHITGLTWHYGYYSTEMLMHKQNQYSSLKAKQKFNQGKRPSLLKLSVVFPLTFFKAYFIKSMWRSGKRGLVHATIDAMYAFLKEAKLFELTERNKKGL